MLGASIDSKSNIVAARIVCRIRPQNLNEKKSGGSSCLESSDTAIEVYTTLGQYPFECDHVFDESSSQSDLFNYCAKPHVEDTLAGINSTILAFGQTGSGKTYSIEGDLNNPERIGIIPRAMIALFNAASDRSDSIDFVFKISYVEIYNEKIIDLLPDVGSNTSSALNSVKIMGVNVNERIIRSHEMFVKLWKAGKSRHHTSYLFFIKDTLFWSSLIIVIPYFI